jgi:hypothetical protein
MNLEIRVLFEAAFWLNLIFTFEKPPLMPFVGHFAVGLALTWYWAWCRGRKAASLDRVESKAYADSFYQPLVWLYMPMFFVMNSGSGDKKWDMVRFVVVLLLVRFYLYVDRQSSD